MSKVRASFIAVEKPGQPGQAHQWGLRKASDVNSVSGMSGNIAEDLSLRKFTSRSSVTMTDGQTERGDLGLILKGSPFEDDKAAHTRQAQNKIGQLDTAKKDHPGPGKVASTASKMKSPTSATKSKPSTTQLDTSKTGLPVKTAPTRQVPPKTSDRSPISPSSSQSAKLNTTHPTPTIRGIRGGPAKIMAVMDSAKKAREGREKKSPVTETKPTQIVKRDTAPKVSDTNGAKQESSSPKVEKNTKLPTQQAKLPAVTTTPAAASAARTDGPPKTLTTDNRRVSAVRKDKPPPKVASTTTASSLAKRTPRTSLAPQTNGHERPRSRVSTAKDESFLARMTRPTASSQQKVHEKVTKPDSPPRARKVSDKVRQSLGPTKDKSENKENEAESPLEATKSAPEVEEQKTEVPAETVVAQEATS